MSADDGPRPPDRRHASEDGSDGDGDGAESMGPLRRVATASSGPLLVVRETAISVGAVAVIGILLFAISGVWPPMVAVESGSMEPHMERGDLVFITDTGRFAPDAARDGTGIVTAETGREVGYRKFGSYGSVIVYDEPGNGGPPVIHRARFWVDEGENWYDRADPDHINADDCGEMRNCPAPHAGFVTKGDANGRYDQVNGISRSGPVKPDWIVGVARVRIPYLGWVRLGVSGVFLDATPETAVDRRIEAPERAAQVAPGPTATTERTPELPTRSTGTAGPLAQSNWAVAGT